MKIQLNSIKSSPKPIRTSWDEEKMCDLVNSLKEEGQVEPIGVHADGDKFTIVWGHRRTEAARRAGWTEIDAVIVPQDEVNNLIQAGIENLASEEMSDDDKANWAKNLLDMGISVSEISRRSSVNTRNIYTWLTYLKAKEEGVIIITPQKGDHAGVTKVRHIVEALGDDLEGKKAVAVKASIDDLSTLQTREVARAYRDAPTPEVKKKILEVPVMSRDTAADILRRSMNQVRMEQGVDSIREMNEWEKEREEKRTFQDFDFAVKEFLDSMRLFQQIAQKGNALVKYGKYSPEAAKFAIRKIDALIDDLKNYKEALENVK